MTARVWNWARQRHWSDWVGYTFYLALAVEILRTSGAFWVLMLPTFLHEILIAGTFLLRGPARRSLPGIAPAAMGFAASFLLPVFVRLSTAFFPAWLAPAPLPGLAAAGVLIWFVGALVGLWPLWHLRRSFAVVPEARTLVTSGPYRYVRHPIYAGYVIHYFGLWLSRPTVALAVALTLWFAIVTVRMRYEEQVLSEAFPEYADYRGRTGRLLPRLG